MNNIFLADTRVYIAGVLMPTIHVGITAAVNQPPMATITLPADHRLFDVGRHDRVPVHIFQRDTYGKTNEFLLMFEGFISGRMYSNLASHRSITINAIGIFDLLNDMRIEFMHSYDVMYKFAVAGNKEINQQQVAGIGYPGCFFLYGLAPENAGKEYEPIKFPYQYLQNVYQYMAGPGEFYDEVTGEKLNDNTIVKKEHDSELSKYFAKQAKYFKLRNRWSKVPYFDEQSTEADAVWTSDSQIFPILKGNSTNITISYLSNSLQSQMDSISTVRGLIDGVAEPMEFEYCTPNAPAFRKGNPKGTTVYEREDRVVSSYLKPIFSDSLPPMCNVIFRSQILQLDAQDTYKGSATRVQIRDINGPLAKLHADKKNPYDVYTAQQLLEIALTNIYPLRDIDKSIISDPTMQKVASYMLDTEEYTGPWIKQVGTPLWWQWSETLTTKDSKEQEPTNTTKFRQKLCHRQLLQAKYANRQLSVQMTFNPYITPGYPCVVFDADDTGLMFAGHVLAVQHSIAPDTMSMLTTVEINYVRTLHEAAAVDIAHPIEDIQNLLHDPEKMTKIYNELLGDEVSETILQMPGAVAKTFSEILFTYASETEEAGPQTNPDSAYNLQRRNICTFDEYVKFMGLEVGFGDLFSMSGTPVEITGDYITKRKPISLYRYVFVPEEEQQTQENPGADVLGGLADANYGAVTTDTQGADVMGGLADANWNVSTQESKAEAATTAGTGKAANQEQKKNENLLSPARETRTEIANKKKGEFRVEKVEVDVREVLKEVAREAFSKQVYA